MSKSSKLMRKCYNCKVDQPASHYNSSKEGLQGYCKSCRRAYAIAHKDRINELARIRHAAKRPPLGELVAKYVLKQTGTLAHMVSGFAFCCKCGTAKNLKLRWIVATDINQPGNCLVICKKCDEQIVTPTVCG